MAKPEQIEQYYKMYRQVVEGRLVGQDILLDVADPDQDVRRERMSLQDFLRGDMPYFSRHVGFALHNNTPIKRPDETYRPASAYFTYDSRFNAVIVEWGEIQGGDAKLHTYLNNVIDYPRRYAEGMIIRSGHLARIKGSLVCYALLDSIAGEKNDGIVPISRPEHPMVSILNRNGYIVFGSDGYICTPERVGPRPLDEYGGYDPKVDPPDVVLAAGI